MNPRILVASLSLSAAALVGIAVHEDFRPDAYPDITGVPTLGYGETKGVRIGDKTTPARALVTLLESAERHADGVRACITVPLYPHEFTAFVSLAYNIGVGAFCGSTLVKLLNQEKYAEACKQILRWDRAGGRQVRGLTVRRQAEYKTCMGQT
jgi:lysozyme